MTWDEVYGNYVVPNTEFTITWLYFAGTKEDPYQSLTGYDTSDGTKVRFFNNASSEGELLLDTKVIGTILKV